MSTPFYILFNDLIIVTFAICSHVFVCKRHNCQHETYAHAFVQIATLGFNGMPVDDIAYTSYVRVSCNVNKNEMVQSFLKLTLHTSV